MGTDGRVGLDGRVGRIGYDGRVKRRVGKNGRVGE